MVTTVLSSAALGQDPLNRPGIGSSCQYFLSSVDRKMIGDGLIGQLWDKMNRESQMNVGWSLGIAKISDRVWKNCEDEHLGSLERAVDYTFITIGAEGK